MLRIPILALLLAAATAAPAAGAGSASVTLEITIADPLAPSYRSCDVAVGTPTNGAAVLDAAVASGCISSWSYEESDGFGRYVTCVDGVCAVFGTYWSYLINGAPACGGVDNVPHQPCAEIHAGDHVELVYTTWLTFLLPPLP